MDLWVQDGIENVDYQIDQYKEYDYDYQVGYDYWLVQLQDCVDQEFVYFGLGKDGFGDDGKVDKVVKFQFYYGDDWDYDVFYYMNEDDLLGGDFFGVCIFDIVLVYGFVNVGLGEVDGE